MSDFRQRREPAKPAVCKADKRMVCRGGTEVALPGLLLPNVLLVTILLPTLVQAAVVELRERVNLAPKSMIQLGDVATVSAADPQLLQRLESVSLIPAPAAGRSARLTYEEVRLRLQACGMNLADIEFRGGHTIDLRVADVPKVEPQIRQAAATRVDTQPAPVRMASATVPARWEAAKANDVINAAFRRAFRTQQAESQGWTFRCSVEPSDIKRIIGLNAEQVQFVESGLPPQSPQRLTAKWQDADGQPQAVVVQVAFEKSPMALAVRQALPTGAILRPEDLIWSPLTDKAGGGIVRLADVIGMQVSRNLKAGQLLQPADLESVPLVRSGEIVTVTVRRNGITVRRPFKSLSVGALHETVNLAALDDPRLRIQAVVTGFHEATVAGEPLEPRNVYRDDQGAVPLSPAATRSEQGGLP